MSAMSICHSFLHLSEFIDCDSNSFTLNTYWAQLTFPTNNNDGWHSNRLYLAFRKLQRKYSVIADESSVQ